jgi:hypothetical protein
MRPGKEDAVNSSDAAEYARALEFFGFGPNEKPDIILLRSRKFNKQRGAKTAEQKALLDRYFQVLAGPPAQPSPPPVPDTAPCSDDTPEEPAEQEFGEDESVPAKENRRRQLDALLPRIEEPIQRLHNDRVINNTFGLMMGLRQALLQVCQLMQDGDVSWVSADQREALVEVLLSLYSSLVMGALHKGELPITNAIIRHKNSILRALDVEIPVGHDPINPQDYSYNW